MEPKLGEELNLNDYQMNNNEENNKFEEIKNELDEKKEIISSLQNELNFYKEKNEELNQELDKLKSSLIDNTILNKEINYLKKELFIKDNQINLKEEENKRLETNIKILTSFIINSLSSLGIKIPEAIISNDFKDIQINNININYDIKNNEELKIFENKEKSNSNEKKEEKKELNTIKNLDNINNNIEVHNNSNNEADINVEERRNDEKAFNIESNNNIDIIFNKDDVDIFSNKIETIENEEVIENDIKKFLDNNEKNENSKLNLKITNPPPNKSNDSSS